jgi:glucokinase
MYIGIDIGGTNIRVAGFTDLTKPEAVNTAKFPTLNDYQQDLTNIVASIQTMAAGTPVEAIGIGVAGMLNKEKSLLVFSPNLDDWINKPLQQDLETICKAPVYLENDAMVSARGEAYYGLGKGRDFLFVIWGTGIGGALIKQIEKKTYVFPSEPGHQILVPDGEVCNCGQKGCFEAYCGGGSIKKRTGKKFKDLTDEEAEKLFVYFSQGLTNLLAMNYSDLVILSGSGALLQKQRLPKLQQMLSERLKIHKTPELLVSELGDLGALYGALALIQEAKANRH